MINGEQMIKKDSLKYMDITIRDSLEAIEQLFCIFNDKFFEGNLIKPILTLNPGSNARKRILGWCSTKRIWINKESKDKYYEITICPEFLDLSIQDISATLLHEMVHLFNIQNDIKDCSRNSYYHNKKFKTEAEKRGLEIQFDKSFGWSITKLNEQGIQFINENVKLRIPPLIRSNGILDENEDDDEKNPKEKKKTSFKYICPLCESSVRATKILKIKCMDCDKQMIEEETE